MKNEKESRDRAYTYYLRLCKEDYLRFQEYLNTVARKKIMYGIMADTTTHYLFHIKLKKQELSFINLAFKVTSEKIKTRKRRK